jgi:hypothetical protein
MYLKSKGLIRLTISTPNNIALIMLNLIAALKWASGALMNQINMAERKIV